MGKSDRVGIGREAGRRIGGLICQARHGAAAQSRGHAGLVARFEREADPNGELSEAERKRAGAVLFQAHMIGLSALSAAARRNKKKAA